MAGGRRAKASATSVGPRGAARALGFGRRASGMACAATLALVCACAQSTPRQTSAPAPSEALDGESAPTTPEASAATASAATTPEASAAPGNEPSPRAAIDDEVAAKAAEPPSSSGTAPSPGVEALEVEGFLPSVLDVPEALRWPQPTLVVAHGARETPEQHCRLWRELVGPRGFVLCPRGKRLHRGRDDAFFYPTHFALEREVLAALDALARRYPDHADTGDAMYIGFSQGGQMGALMIAAHGARLPRLLLVEGGSGDLVESRARRYRESGGRAVQFVCGTSPCRGRAERSARLLEKLGLASRAHFVAGAGHDGLDRMRPTLIAAFGALTSDDPRWAAP